MQNLLVMSANRAGLDYGQLFNNLSAGSANALLGSMVSYLKEVASSNNNIVKSQYANLFGVEVSDLNAFTNIQNSVIEELMMSGMTYSDTLAELNEQLGEVPNRIHISERMDILLDNIFANLGTQLAGNTALSGIYKAASFLEGVTGGIELPFISWLGSGFDLNMTLEGLIKSSVVGIGTIGTIIDALGNIGGSMDINDWSVTMNKGEGLRYKNVRQMTSTTSTTGTISSSSSTGISQSLSDQQKAVGEEVNGNEPDKDEELLVILRALKQYFVEDKFGSETNPVKSQVTVTNFNELSTLEGLLTKTPT